MEKKKIPLFLDLFLTMMKIGLFTFGGGYAMIALLDSELVEKKKWISKDEFLDVVAIAESTPGPIAINCSTYIGYKKKGIIGSILCTLGVCIPSFVIIFIISLFYEKFIEISLVSCAFKGIQACVVFLILKAGIKMIKNFKKNVQNIILFVLTVCCMICFSLLSIKFSSVFYVLIGGFISVVIYITGYLINKNKEQEL